MFKTLKNKKGLTLIELIAVLVILGIIAAIAIPTIGNTISNNCRVGFVVLIVRVKINSFLGYNHKSC